MDETEKRAISTSLPDIIARVAINTTFKAAVYSSGLWEDEALDNLMASSKGKDFLFRLSQSVKKTTLQDAFDIYVKMFRDLGESGVADLLQSEAARHSHLCESLRTRKESENVNLTATSLMDKSAIACSSVSPPPRPPLTQEYWRGLRKRIRETLPPSGSTAMGDVAVTLEYYSKVYAFASPDEPHESPPGPLEGFNFSTTRFANQFYFLPPTTCAVILRELGGSPQHLLRDKYRRGNITILKTVEGVAQYCKVGILLDPGKITKADCWLSLDHTVGEALRGFTHFETFGAKFCNPGEILDLSLTVSQWLHTTKSEFIKVFECRQPSARIPVSEKRCVIARCFHPATSHDDWEQAEALVTFRYYQRVAAFASDPTAPEPGPVQEPDLSSAAINFENTAFLPPECCSTLINFYGGHATLHLLAVNGKKQLALDDIEGHSAFYVCKLYASGSQLGTRGTHLGTFYFSRNFTLEEAIAAAIGYYPSRAHTPHSVAKMSHSDLDLRMNVRTWHKSSKIVSIVVSGVDT